MEAGSQSRMEIRIKEETYKGLKHEDRKKLQKVLLDEISEGRIQETFSEERGYQLTNAKLDISSLNTQTSPLTSHPGDRIPTVWDYRDEEQDTDDEPLSSEQLAIHIPPDSPTLGRPYATTGCQTWDEYCKEQTTKMGQESWRSEDWDVYPSFHAYKDYLRTEPSYASHKQLVTPRKELQDKEVSVDRSGRQALLITDESPRQTSWVDETEEEYQQQTVRSARRSVKYTQNARNLKHRTISRTVCVTDSCPIHLHEKRNAGWFPTLAKRCKHQWFDCAKHQCAQNLYDKRTSEPFYPYIEDSEISQQVLINDSCVFPHWHRCLQEHGDKLQENKAKHGYLDLGDEETYSDDQSADDEKPVLEQRPAPEIDTKAATLPIRARSLSSQ
jgi:hypothetical protein